ncbi:MAG: type II secretion system protein GspG [Phycisphaerales bacterium JB039]
MTLRLIIFAVACLALGACEESGSSGSGPAGTPGTFTLRPQTLVTKADLHPISQAVSMFEIDMGRYPAADEGLDVLLSADAITEGDDGKWNGPYLQREQDLLDPYGNRVEYERTATGFLLRSLGADGAPGGTGSSQDIELRK